MPKPDLDEMRRCDRVVRQWPWARIDAERAIMDRRNLLDYVAKLEAVADACLHDEDSMTTRVRDALAKLEEE